MAQRKQVKQKTAQEEFNDSIRNLEPANLEPANLEPANLEPAVCGPVAFRHLPQSTWSGSRSVNVSFTSCHRRINNSLPDRFGEELGEKKKSL
jgi:hypothetical protein